MSKQDNRPTKSVAQACADGDLRGMLVAAQAIVARKLDDPDTRAADVAALTKRLREITDEIAEIDAAAETDPDSVAAAAATPDEQFDGNSY
ncbi:terminase small subunit [Mycobacterium phage Patt]|uniref:Uncharacterized protein n=3 Tax=Fionnbharthvirus TaxID=2948708 RepID=A0A1J0MDE4_9CAUD|nr:terminase small subunit [Mycobacterium phage Cheetobro]YP_009950443.1 terminase small subunit [Mycobacterium phage Taquito]YP_009950539.1 terminase small subunit [Mycobacterium phage Patt]ALA46280.1 hypothetical protein PBI_SLARP_8 [Mycobacterium phage Slarp]APD19144.1 hypothetical protein SEA_MITTI_8 [Mycobacterium phage Mitti]ASW31661.1 hypothetical protein SEA_CHANCELLOR_8 [Mycobacterium phage Chancellor]AVR77325.1 hypothetical protein SEA_SAMSCHEPPERS_6 [Mycobacterium phage SamSchepper